MDLATLQAVLAPLAEVGKDEREFLVEGHKITVRPLLPHEEVSVQRFAVDSLEDVEKAETDEDAAMTRADALDYFDRFRIEVIAHSMVEINGTDLRVVDFIPTGEVTSTGVEVKVPRYEAMRKIIRDSWSRTMITTAFTQYGELIETLSRKADDVAELSETDLAAEIDRVKHRLRDLRGSMENRAKGDSGIPKEQIDKFVGVGQNQEELSARMVDNADRVARDAQPLTAEEIAAAQQPTPQQPTPQQLPPQQSPPQQSPPQRPPPQQPPPVTFEEARSSFEDGEDPEVLAAEQHRIMAARRKVQESQREHLSQGSVPQQTTAIEGVETYRMPTEELSPRGKRTSKAPQLDPTSQGERNPKFGRK